MPRLLHAAFCLVLVALAGCSVDPPLALERDPSCAELALAPPQRVQASLALVGGAQGWGQLAVVGSDVAPVSSLAPGVLPAPREYSASTPVDRPAVARRLADVVGWGVAAAPVTVLEAADTAPVGSLLAAAEAAHAELLIHVGVEDARTAFVDTDGFWWWHNLIMFWVPGVYPVVLIPDEIFESSLHADVTVVHVASGQPVLARRFDAAYEQSLNDAQRGWSVAGICFLYPWLLDDEVYRDVSQALGPHAQKELERQVVAWLGRELPPRLAGLDLPGPTPAAPSSPQTYALVVGYDGPSRAAVDRPGPLLRAEADAAAAAKLWRTSGTTPAAQQVTLLGEDARASAVLAAVDDLAVRMRPDDQLVVYVAGYGTTDLNGVPELLLVDRRLPLAELAEHLRATPEQASVTLLLDTSFGGSQGRSYPGGERLSQPLLRQPSGRSWRLFSASQPGDPALEFNDEPHGLFTTWLLAGAQGPADGDGDGAVTSAELYAWAAREVAVESQERVGERQRICLLESEPVVLFQVKPAEGQ